MIRSAFFFTVLILISSGVSAGHAQEPSAPATTQPQAVVYVCPMHPEVQSKVPGKCPKCNMTLVALKQDGGNGGNGGNSGEEGFYTCPMHPEVQTSQPGICPKCKMKLVRSAPPESSEYVVRMETTPRLVRSGEKVRLRFTIFHPATEKQVKEFAILHDMPLHLFVISQDLDHFEHIHPTQQADGSFVIDTSLPQPGHYKVFCDFFPKGGTPQVIQLNLITAGFSGDLVSAQAKLVPDKSFSKTVDGTHFDLHFEPAQVIAGKPAQLKYHLTDARTGEPVNDLKPYLGAWGHTLILSDDGTDYLHSHPAEMIPDDVDRSRLVGSPDVAFETFFPHPGYYRIWSQFQRQEKLITVSFTVYVPRLQ